MYEHHFGLAEAPFSIAPDPRYLYLSQRHQEALAHLLYGVNGDGGFVLLTGEVGAGKTTVCRCLLEQIPETCDVAFIFNPKLSVEELLSTICAEFGIACPQGNHSVKVFVDCINAYLLDAHARGRHTVLIIDEAQNLSPDVLEQMRLLTNLETNRRKLLQIILLGQPELAAMLARPELRQLAQRIVARYHLGPLAREEVAAYVEHRLAVSGAQRTLFGSGLMPVLYRITGGVPRLINLVCDRALLGAYAGGRERVDRKTLARAAREVLPGTSPAWNSGKRIALAAGIALMGAGALALDGYRQDWWQVRRAAPPPAPVAAPAPAPVAVEKAVVAPAEPLAPRVSWPAALPREKSEGLAYAALFKAWDLDAPAGFRCRQPVAGLHCKTGRGSLDELRGANRPAVLRLRNEQGQDFYAALIALDDTSATFALDDQTQKVAPAALGIQWTGEYSLLWRASPERSEAIAPGARGPAVDWLAGALAQARGEHAVQPAGVFDAALAQQVKQFQIAHGLTPDGAVGPQTLMRLAAVVDDSAPALVRK
jgi:general secretion pathway protein A